MAQVVFRVPPIKMYFLLSVINLSSLCVSSAWYALLIGKLSNKKNKILHEQSNIYLDLYVGYLMITHHRVVWIQCIIDIYNI